MARLRLSSATQARVADASTVLLSSLAYPSVGAWQRDVCRHTRELFGADMAAVLVPLHGAPAPFSDELSLATMYAYPAAVNALDARHRVWARQAELNVLDRRTMWGTQLPAVRASPYWQDFIVPNRLFDTVGLVHHVRDAGATPGVSAAAALWLYHEHETREEFGPDALAILRLLLPAFRAGVELLHRAGAERARWARLLDTLVLPLLLADLDGRVVHRSPTLNAVLAADPDGPALARAMQASADAVAALARGRFASGRHAAGAVAPFAPPAVAAVYATRAGRFALRAALAEAEPRGQTFVLVTLTPEVPAAPRNAPWTTGAWAAALSDRFGLTRAQADVARLVAGGASPAAAAGRLGIRLSTVRHHLEQVRQKLGVRSTAAAVARLHEAVTSDGTR